MAWMIGAVRYRLLVGGVDGSMEVVALERDQGGCVDLPHVGVAAEENLLDAPPHERVAGRDIVEQFLRWIPRRPGQSGLLSSRGGGGGGSG